MLMFSLPLPDNVVKRRPDKNFQGSVHVCLSLHQGRPLVCIQIVSSDPRSLCETVQYMNLHLYVPVLLCPCSTRICKLTHPSLIFSTSPFGFYPRNTREETNLKNEEDGKPTAVLL